ncbi:MAG: hypothetical protein NUV91_02375 [Candidatus Omnitrophica bacterium]|nr:hypothetical protein [Candidatus Omnitrophota bacterium]
MKTLHIVLGVTGSIAAYKAGDLIRRLRDPQGKFRSYDVRVFVLMTKEAEDFISPLTLGSLSGEKVYRSSGNWLQESEPLSHIWLAQHADVFLVAPATANIVGKLAQGIADDLITTTFLATRAPILLAPAMNDQMYAHPFVQENFKKLKKFGTRLIEPVKGHLACGSFGEGHLAEIDDIVKAVAETVAKKK